REVSKRRYWTPEASSKFSRALPRAAYRRRVWPCEKPDELLDLARTMIDTAPVAQRTRHGPAAARCALRACNALPYGGVERSWKGQQNRTERLVQLRRQRYEQARWLVATRLPFRVATIVTATLSS